MICVLKQNKEIEKHYYIYYLIILPINFWGGSDMGTLSILGVSVMPEALLMSEKSSHCASGSVWLRMVTSNCGGGAGTCRYSVTSRLWRSMSSIVFFSVIVRRNTSSTTWEVISGFLNLKKLFYFRLRTMFWLICSRLNDPIIDIKSSEFLMLNVWFSYGSYYSFNL